MGTRFAGCGDVRTLEELSNALLDGGNTGACAVGTDTANIFQEESRALQHIGLVSQAAQQDLLVLQELRMLEKTQDLAEEGDGLLVELLRVADIGADDLGERQAGIALSKGCAVFLRLDGQLATHSILGLDDLGLDVPDMQPGHLEGGMDLAG